MHYTNYTTPQLQLHYNYNCSCSTPHYIQQLWPRQPLQPLQKTPLQPPFSPSVDSLCQPWITTTSRSYRFPILKLPPLPCAVLLVHKMNVKPSTISTMVGCMSRYLYTHQRLKKTKSESTTQTFPWLSWETVFCGRTSICDPLPWESQDLPSTDPASIKGVRPKLSRPENESRPPRPPRPPKPRFSNVVPRIT